MIESEAGTKGRTMVSNPDGAGHAALKLVDALISILADEGVITPGQRKALIATTMDRLQTEAGSASRSALEVLQNLYVEDET
jgi:hypothetical protein